MSRSGYSDDCDDDLAMGRWRGMVASAIRGKRGQVFLKDLAKAMDEMPKKKLIAGDLITNEGEVCAIGAFCKSKKIDVSEVDIYDHDEVGSLVNIAHQMAAEIAFQNDEGDSDESDEARWIRMRKWVGYRIKKENVSVGVESCGIRVGLNPDQLVPLETRTHK